jgi:hypothetical protein
MIFTAVNANEKIPAYLVSIDKDVKCFGRTISTLGTMRYYDGFPI